MLLISNGIYSIFDPIIRKHFRTDAIIVTVLVIILFAVTGFVWQVLLLIPLGIGGALIHVTSGKSQEYELRDKDKKIVFKKTYYFNHLQPPLNNSSRGSALSHDYELDVYIVITAITKIYFEQSNYEKKRDIGRIYFLGTSTVEAERPLKSNERQAILTPYAYQLYGVENFSRITDTLRNLLPPEKFTDKNPISYDKPKKKKDNSPFLRP